MGRDRYFTMDDSDDLGPTNLSRSSSLRSSGSNRTSLVRRNQSMSAKQIRFYRNGDRYYSGLKLAVSSERYKEFESLLGELSIKLNLSTGAVRYIFNAEDNSMITDISQLHNGVSYVCSSTNTFRQLEGGYGKHMYSWSVISKSKEQAGKPNVLGNVENFHHIAFRSESARDYIKPKLVTVIRNGKPPQKKVTLLLNSKTAVSLDQVLDQLSAKGSLGKVDKLYSVDGRGIKTLRDLFDDDTVFIALTANEKFPEDGIELDPNNYRITPYRELKRPCNVNVRRANSMRLRKLKDENENVNIAQMSRTPPSTNSRRVSTKSPGAVRGTRPKNSSRKLDYNKDELYPTAVFESDSESDSSECSRPRTQYSMFGIKKDKARLHGSYRIGRIIGDGNFAVVRECTHRKSHKSYALKIINKSKVKGKEHMIENEIHILRKIAHPNIVKLHEEFETHKEIYLVMELVTGGDLFDAIVANTRFSEPDAAFMIRDLAFAVKYLHELNIVHRDIKPENLLVVNRSDGRRSTKLADFGLSIEVTTPMFLVCGTPTYVAPEILDESGYGMKVDVWAIGVICYILLCGFPPFRSSNHDQEELFDKILRGDYEYLQPFWDDIDEGPKDLIDRLLVVDASERYDAWEVLEHYWIKKWVEPVEKIHRQLSEAEVANVRNRKRLRGVAMAIQSVISLLHLVRSRRALEQALLEQSSSINGDNQKASVNHNDQAANTNSVTSPVDRVTSPVLSRIPRPRPSAGVHIAEIRKSITSPDYCPLNPFTFTSSVPHLKPAQPPSSPECTLKKGFLKREETISQRPDGRPRRPSKPPVNRSKVTQGNAVRKRRPSTGVPQESPVRRQRPTAISLRKNLNDLDLTRPSSAGPCKRLCSPTTASSPGYVGSNLKAKVDPTSSVKLRDPNAKRRISRARPRSLIETSAGVASDFNLNDLSTVTETKSAGNSRSNLSRYPCEAMSKPDTTFIVHKTHDVRTKIYDTASENEPRKVGQPETEYQAGSCQCSPRRGSSARSSGRFLAADVKQSRGTVSRSSSVNSVASVDSATHDRSRIKSASTNRVNSVQLNSTRRSVSLSRQGGKKSVLKHSTSLHSQETYKKRKELYRVDSLESNIRRSGRRRKSSTSSESSLPPWNPSTRPDAKPSPLASPMSPRKTFDFKNDRKIAHSRIPKCPSESDKNIRITTEVNKRKNIKFPDGKTVDEEVKTKTTVSVNMDPDEEERRETSLLDKVKTLAIEIGSLAKATREYSLTSSTDSVGEESSSSSTRDFIRTISTEETDRFSETEYLSAFRKN